MENEKMEKIIQEFRIIETEDGFRIEIKGNKEELRDFVMSLDPRNWAKHNTPWDGPWSWHGKGTKRRHGGGFPFAPGAFFGWGPWGAWGEEDDDDDEPKAKRKKDDDDTV